MIFGDIFDEARRALATHRLRTMLSSAGIVFGIATVMTALAVGEGARREALADIGSLGIENLYVRAVSSDSDSREPPQAPGLGVEDATAIRQRVSQAVLVAAVRSTRGEVDAGPASAAAPILGVDAAWGEIVGIRLSEGRWLHPHDERTRRRVGVVGTRLASALFPEDDPIGQVVRAGGRWYQIIGVVAESRGTPAPRSSVRPDLGGALIVPRSTLDMSIGVGDDVDRVSEIAIRTASAETVVEASTAVARAIADPTAKQQAFELIVPRELLQARLRARRTFDVLMLATGGLALLISGIGIMNIMLASVNERTHEIGLRRACGARRRDIIVQHTAESVLLCLLGSTGGVPLGVLLSVGVNVVAGWPVAVSLSGFMLAIALAGGVGVAFGVYPARLAAALDPAEALRA
jgi:putative ABC transport system permease protein